MIELFLVATAAFLLFSLWYHFWVRIPLRKMTAQVRRLLNSDFSGRIDFGPHDIRSVDRLSQSMNELSLDLETKWRTLVQSRDQMRAVFSSMAEGVIAVNADERIIFINQAAAQLFSIDLVQSVGRSIQETVRNPEIQDFIQNSLVRDEAAEQDVEVMLGHDAGHESMVLQLRSRPLINIDKQRIGTVLGYNNITQLRRLESHRSDFVANVSHELRTPMTSIQGFAETLLNSDLKDIDQSKKFLEIIHRHSTRLSDIIEDLLSLSRIEKDASEHTVELRHEALRPVVGAAVELCQLKAKKKNMEIAFICPPEIKAKINAPLLEQALVNLIDNAISYSDDGKKIEIKVAQNEKEVTIQVKDSGYGIAKEHLPRLFERFYRVDKGRSRNSGGTGLGLSIVKHVTLAHQGHLDVQSEIGQGSQFSIHLPLK